MSLYAALYDRTYGPLYGANAPAVGPPLRSQVPNTPTPRTQLGGLFDQLLDPVTLDYVDAPDGSWIETADSRTIVMIMLETRLGKSYLAPGDGTRIRDLLDTGNPVTVAVVAAEYSRAMSLLERAGILTDFSITTNDANRVMLVDESGRFSPVLRWRDLASGTPVDLVYAPFEGT